MESLATHMRLGIHRTLFRTAKKHLLFYLASLLCGATLCFLCVQLILRRELPLSLFLPGVALGVGAMTCYGILLVQLFRWLRRATWVLRSVEPEAMRLTLHLPPPQRFGGAAAPLATLRPVHARSRISPKVDLPVYFPVRRHRRKDYYARHNVTVAVFADPRRGGPLVIRLEGRLFCSQRQSMHTPSPAWLRQGRHREQAKRSAALVVPAEQ